MSVGNGAGMVVAASGPVVRASGLDGAAVGEVVRIGDRRLLGEIIRLDGTEATIQVYEETGGLEVGDPVQPTGAPLLARLGPGLLGRTFDGLQRPLDRLAAAGRWLLLPGLAEGAGAGRQPGTGGRAGVGREPGSGASAGACREPGTDRPAGRSEETGQVSREEPGHADPSGAPRWAFHALRGPGERVGPGDVLGTVDEGPLRHRILVPPDAPAGVLRCLTDGCFGDEETIGWVDAEAGRFDLRLTHHWPIRQPRPARRRTSVDRPLVTGQRVFDMLFPIARGGAAVIPGGFGTGKTVVEQSLARWADADVVVYVGCGERGNEIAELLDRFPALLDPRSGAPLLARTVLIANTSNMPVAAREASVQLGITIAEYFRDQGLDVLVLADSTSRWAEALREVSGRLEELPGEEGFPAYLGSRLAAFYERAGRADVIGDPDRMGSITLVGAVSPPGGDFSEPVTQASLRLAGTFWALDAELAHARHFPAVGWTTSYSLDVDRLAPWYREHVDDTWPDRRAEAVALLAREKQLLDIVQLVGADALPDDDRVDLVAARLLRETFLQQHAFDPIDAARPLDVQFALLRAVLAAGTGIRRAIERGAILEQALDAPILDELRRARYWSGSDLTGRLAALGDRLADLDVEDRP